jgi:D-alanyl-D-alanine carboxypeptidase
MNFDDFLHVDTSNLNKDVCNKMAKRVKFKQKHSTESTLDKIESEQVDDKPRRGVNPKVITNTYFDYFNDCVDLDKLRTMNRDVEDVLVGVSRLDWYKTRKGEPTLSVKKLIYLFKELREFTVKGVSTKLELENTQGKVYTRACALVITHLNRIENLPYIVINDVDSESDF